MAFLKNIFVCSGAILFLAISIGVYQEYTEESDRLVFEKWSEKNKIDLSSVELKNFKIEFNQEEWNDLIKRLENTRYFNVLNESFVQRFEYGFDPEYAEKLVNYWKKEFDWKNTIEYLNKFEQFKIKINQVDIHFSRIKTSKDKKNAVPLLLLDGWPGSFVGFYKMIDYFIQQDVAYDIIVPSIPGYGYSTPLQKPVGIIETSSYFDAIMRFAHGESVQYFIHGEDWGALICSIMAHMYPQRVKGIHSTMPELNPFFSMKSSFHYIASSIFPSHFLTEQENENKFYERYSITSYLKIFFDDFGYFHLQTTKPDTLAHGLTDSPAGLLAYILEKYSSWSFNFKTEIVGSPSGNLKEFKKDDLLTVASIYWFTNSISSSIRFYKSYKQDIELYPVTLIESIKCYVPLSVQLSVNELIAFPSNTVKQKFPNLKKFEITKTGHFAAFQTPKLTGDNIIEFINSVY